MIRTLVAGLSFAASFAFGLVSEPVDAAQTRAKAKQSADTPRAMRRLNSISRVDGNESAGSRQVALRDRSTINLPNGRLNGKEFFESLQERSTGAGE